MQHLRNLVDQILVPHTAFAQAAAKIDQCFKAVDGANEPICLAVIGESRTGKSRVQEYVQSQHPAIRTEDGLIAPVFRVVTPPIPTIKGLAETMLEAMGDPKYDKGTERTKTRRLIKLLKKARTKMVVLDEFQHFYDQGSHKIWYVVANWLKTFIDQTKVALLVAGLPSCRAVIDQNEQLRGRFMAPVMMPRFDWQNDASRAEFIAILSAFHEVLSQHFDMPALDTEDMAFRMFCATGGLIGYLAKLLRQAVWNAVDASSPIITLENLALAYEAAVWNDARTSSLPRPFERSFSVTPTTELLALVRHVGEASLEAEHTSHTRARKPPEPKLGHVLSAA